MADDVIAARAQFAFTIMFHYLFPILSMGLGTMIAIFKTIQFLKHDERCGAAVRFWTRIFAANFAVGVVTGIPLEFQFGTNWAGFSDYSGGIVGQTLVMEGVYAFFLESGFLGILLLGEGRVPSWLHWLSSVLVAAGTLISGYFIVMTDAWMQHPVAYQLGANGRLELTSLWAVLTNPYGGWQYWHTINGALTTGAMVVAGLGAYYLLARRHEDFGRLCVQFGVLLGCIFAVIQLFPTGSRNGETVARLQPVKTAAMEGLFHTSLGAPLAIIGMPDPKTSTLLDPILIPSMLSILAYGNASATVKGLDDYPPQMRPPMEVVYYAYHIMVGLGTVFIGLLGFGVLLLWLKRLYTERWYLWLLMLAMPLPYIANEAGWTVAEVGRQPWIAYGLMRTETGVSPNVTSGETVFTLLGFMGMYALIGLLFLYIVMRLIAGGPEETRAIANSSAPEAVKAK